MFRNQRKNKRWTPEEVAKLRQLTAQNVLPVVMSKTLGRSVTSLYSKASKLRLELPRSRERPRYSGRKLTVPTRGHRLIIEFFQLVIARKISLKKLMINSGYSYATVHSWKKGGHMPKLTTFDDILNCLGFKLMIVPIDMEYGDVVNFVTHTKENGNASSK